MTLTTERPSVYDTHPLAMLIPAMGEDEFANLRQDIEANGLRVPILLYEGKVLDGRHRLRACEETGVAPTFERYNGDEPAAHVLSLNLHRRHLSVSQRAMIATDFLPALTDEFKRRQAAALDARRGPDGRAHADQNGSKEPLRSAPGPNRAQRDAGQIVGVSRPTIDRAVRVARLDPDLAERVRDGELTVSAAHDMVQGAARKPPLIGVDITATVERSAPDQDVPLEGRHLLVANKHRQRLQVLVGTCQAFSALDELKVELAARVAEPDEIASWDEVIKQGIDALTRVRRRLPKRKEQ